MSEEQQPLFDGDDDKELKELLNRAGLRQVRAWMPDKDKQRSSNAKRQQRKMERLKAQGIEQLNVHARTEAHEVLRAIAEASRQGDDLVQALRSIVGQLDPDSVRDLDPADRRLLQAAHSPGLRGRLLRFLGGM